MENGNYIPDGTKVNEFIPSVELQERMNSPEILAKVKERLLSALTEKQRIELFAVTANAEDPAQPCFDDVAIEIKLIAGIGCKKDVTQADYSEFILNKHK